MTTSHSTKVGAIAVCLALLCGINSSELQAQSTSSSTLAGQNSNYIPTGMPLLMVASDAVSSGMGDVGVASTPDANSTHWNNAKYAFIENNFGATMTYTPWFRKSGLTGANLLYLSGYKRINKRSTVAAGIMYFTLGETQNRSSMNDYLGSFTPNESAFDITYAMKISDNLSIGASARYIRSDITDGATIDGTTTKPARSMAADVGLYYQQSIDEQQNFAFGVHISNLGAKLSYSDDNARNEFLPANLRLGGRYTYNIDEYNKVNVMLDLNKLLVPTPPIKINDSTYSSPRYATYSDYTQTGAILGAIQSFYDAPGGLKEELKEIQLSAGAEYWYSNTFVARGGVFYESNDKGGRRYATLGAGLRYNMFNIDLSYLIPLTKFGQNYLANTIRITLTFNAQRTK